MYHDDEYYKQILAAAEPAPPEPEATKPVRLDEDGQPYQYYYSEPAGKPQAGPTTQASGTGRTTADIVNEAIGPERPLPTKKKATRIKVQED